MIGASERVKIIRSLAKKRLLEKPVKGREIKPYEVDNLPEAMVWGLPEGTIFNIINPFLRESQKGYTMSEIINELEEIDASYDNRGPIPNLPENLNDYIRLKVGLDHGAIFSMLFDDDFLNYCYEYISQQMGYVISNKSNQTQSSSSSFNSDSYNTPKKTKEGCYIATACYGSYHAPEVIILRKFRDDFLSRLLIGSLFIRLYYGVSPLFVRYAMKNPAINLISKYFLDNFVRQLNHFK